jgi:hypothetical protein
MASARSVKAWSTLATTASVIIKDPLGSSFGDVNELLKHQLTNNALLGETVGNRFVHLVVGFYGVR